MSTRICGIEKQLGGQRVHYTVICCFWIFKICAICACPVVAHRAKTGNLRISIILPPELLYGSNLCIFYNLTKPQRRIV
jgi:hypothetical protein